jgi:hypothetical protein
MIRLALLSHLRGEDRPPDAYLEPLLRLERTLPAHGLTLVRDRPDVVLADCELRTGAETSAPLILFDRTDGAMLWWHGTDRVDLAREWVRSPRVCGVVKISRYRDLSLYNTPWVGGAYHLAQIRETAGDAFHDLAPWPVLPLEEGHFKKLGLGFGFWAFAACDRLAEAPGDLDAPRGIDVFFAGSVDHTSPLLAHHRGRALDQVRRLRGTRTVVARGRVLAHADYCELLRQSWVCVSPWGWGETTVRDDEALLAGCVLVKPRTDFIDSLLPLEERHYVPCAVDFADLQEKVDVVLSRWADYEDMRRANRDRLLAARRPDVMAVAFARLVRGFMGEEN